MLSRQRENAIGMRLNAFVAYVASPEKASLLIETLSPYIRPDYVLPYSTAEDGTRHLLYGLQEADGTVCTPINARPV